jgi:hypothetical protein
MPDSYDAGGEQGFVMAASRRLDQKPWDRGELVDSPDAEASNGDDERR